LNFKLGSTAFRKVNGTSATIVFADYYNISTLSTFVK
jgi:hypothetical protein